MAVSRKISFSTKLFYGVGSIANGVNSNTFSYFMLFFYSQVVGVEGFLVGIAMLFMMLADAFSDPIIGHVSDNWKSKLGRRHHLSLVSPSGVWWRRCGGPVRGGHGGGLRGRGDQRAGTAACCRYVGHEEFRPQLLCDRGACFF